MAFLFSEGSPYAPEKWMACGVRIGCPGGLLKQASPTARAEHEKARDRQQGCPRRAERARGPPAEQWGYAMTARVPLEAAQLKAAQDSWDDQQKDMLETNIRWRQWAVRASIGFFGLAVFFGGIAALVIYRYSQPLPTHLLAQAENNQYQVVPLVEAKASWGELEDKFWAAQYVIHHETYEFYSQQAHYDAVGLMSAPDVAEAYAKRYQGAKGLDKVLGDSEKQTPKIWSVVVKDGVATVRFSVTRKLRSSPLPEPPKFYIVSFGYDYSNILLNAEQRLINPKGYTAYNFDPQEEVAANVGGGR